ncbi:MULTISPECIES: D-2-hydroxyacid dehydrogenase family protein [Bacillus]|jgi:D-3-phosphoglycerate dehydrogenase|uniref:D-2-hydroxyacid dehydrogenase family protein n=1 Tax=Bacillus TaxID=1386 RepID=UPI0022E7316A|nr:D-2-hydroxyacid dehydrogenase family protein [Bacillus smithii]MED1421604.1 D-2-hydroxyacid dehydrogenase family protein [Bacillus smithii]MED1457213.1 D-2-hydroxyacid dehydrogenase family protein [Bacillus smithii]
MKVVILDDWEKSFFCNPQLEILKKHFEVEIYHDKPTNEILINRISDADIIIPIRERTKFTKEILQQLKKVKLIAQTGAGLAHIDMEEANRLNIPVSTTPGGSAAVVELIFGFMIAYSRQLITIHQEMKSGNWPCSVGFGLEGKTIGIIGLGKIGSGVAKVAKAFNMNVLAWGPRLTQERASEQGVAYTSLENLLQQSHFVVIAIRLVPETRKLLTKSHFNLMRKDAFLINTSRGDVLDEEALVHALKEKQIGGAGLDVFSQEPLSPDSPLLKLDNVILSPHIGWKTDNMFNKFLTVSIENIVSYFIHNHPIRIANPEVLKKLNK